MRADAEIGVMAAMMLRPAESSRPKAGIRNGSYDMKCSIALSLAGACMAPILSAQAADMSIPAPAPERRTSIGLEFIPSYYARDSHSHQSGDWADNSLKLSLSHSFDTNWILGGRIETTFKPADQYHYYGEGSLGYRFRFDRFSLTPSLGLGYTWDETGITIDGVPNSDAFYYAFTLAGDFKLSQKWTWHAFNLRYRNAFDATWITPKAATGLSYAIDDANSISANVGYSWKDTGEGLKGDKISAAFGFKHAF